MSKARNLSALLNDSAQVTSEDIADNTISSDKIVSGAIEQSLVVPSGRRNMIINGAMVVAQRGESAVTTDILDLVTFPKVDYGLHDRWRTNTHTTTGATVGRFTTTRPRVDNKYWFRSDIETGIDGTAYVYRGSAYFQESQDFLDMGLAGKEVTVSFLFKAKTNGQYSFAFGSPNGQRFSIFSWDYTGPGSEQKVTKTFTIPTDWETFAEAGERGFGLYMCYGVATGSALESGAFVEGNFPSDDSTTHLTHPNDYKFWEVSGEWIAFTEVQVELGPVATPFEHRSYGEELALCQRYYQSVFFAIGGESPANVINSILFPVTFRGTPTIGTSMLGGGSPPFIWRTEETGIGFYLSSGTGHVQCRGSFLLDADL